MSPAAMTVKQAYEGRRVVFKILGRASLNAQPFCEIFAMEVAGLPEGCTMADIVANCVRVASARSDIPADLVEGVELRFEPRGKTG